MNMPPSNGFWKDPPVTLISVVEPSGTLQVQRAACLERRRRER